MKDKIKAIKHFGQNFLINSSVVLKLVESANLNKEDIVLEIGPGTGILTKEIAKQVKKVIAIEKDPRMITILKENLRDFNNIELIEGDILRFNDFPKDYKVVANIPFYLTASLIRKLLEEKNQPKEITLIVQKEVAKRICAKPPKTNILATAVQFYATPKILSYISRRSFHPVPKVDSAIIKIIPQKQEADSKKFFKLVKLGFTHPRKQLINNLSIGFKKEGINSLLLKNNIQPTQRAETLSTGDWIKLIKML